ncbi:zinc ribbon-containing protein [Halotalea alkalilenta]|uniref:zinc ribbon-containing protein n=1 Tax=Halotalea alkalilenta TaxID=376489 RepID=UPI0005BB067B|nr:hypothetical protein [Halotalea alkalilenta]
MNEVKGGDSKPEVEPRPARLESGYQRILERLGVRRDAGEVERGREGFERQLDEAVNFEAELTEYTKDELALLREWVRRDVSELGGYLASGGGSVAQWLGIDVDVISEQVRNALFGVADRTTLDLQRFDEQLEAAQADYCEGEVIAPGRLGCVHCGERVTITAISRLEPCHSCGHRFFKRAPMTAEELE